MLNQHTRAPPAHLSAVFLRAWICLFPFVSVCSCVWIVFSSLCFYSWLIVCICTSVWACVSACERGTGWEERDASRVYYLCEAYGRKKESCCVYICRWGGRDGVVCASVRVFVLSYIYLASWSQIYLLQGINISLDNFLAADQQQLAWIEPLALSFNRGPELQFLAGTLGFVRPVASRLTAAAQVVKRLPGRGCAPSFPRSPLHLYSAEPVESLSDKAVKEWEKDGFGGGCADTTTMMKVSPPLAAPDLSYKHNSCLKYPWSAQQRLDGSDSDQNGKSYVVFNSWWNCN